DDIVPGVLVEVGARLAYELMKVLEFFVARAELSVSRRPDRGRLVHQMPPKTVVAFRLSCPVASRYPKMAWLAAELPCHGGCLGGLAAAAWGRYRPRKDLRGKRDVGPASVFADDHPRHEPAQSHRGAADAPVFGGEGIS